MLIPLLGVTADGTPVISEAAKGEASTEGVFEVARRLGVASPLCLSLAPGAHSIRTDDMQKLLLQTPCIVGPFQLGPELDAARDWLNAGAQYALLAVSRTAAAEEIVGKVRAALAEVAIPGDRVLLALEVGALTSSADVLSMCGLMELLAAPKGCGCHECKRPETVGVVSGVVLCLPTAADAALEDELFTKLSPLSRSDRLSITVGGPGCATHVASD